jgi:hypothetical protein
MSNLIVAFILDATDATPSTVATHPAASTASSSCYSGAARRSTRASHSADNDDLSHGSRCARPHLLQSTTAGGSSHEVGRRPAEVAQSWSCGSSRLISAYFE